MTSPMPRLPKPHPTKTIQKGPTSMIEDTSKRSPFTHLVGLADGNSSAYIEGMEAAGQRQLVAATETMPAEGNWAALQELGFAAPQPTDDDLFVTTVFPEGWQKAATDHSMWSSVVDERGIERVGVFYKAAFYDRRASFSITNVGAHLATEAIYGDDEPALPAQWRKLTAAEQLDFARGVRSYQKEAAESPAIYGDRLPRAETVLALSEDHPRFDTCCPDIGRFLHTLESAFGRTWCECNHTAIVRYRNNTGAGTALEDGKVPRWWRKALKAAHKTDPRGTGEFKVVWDALQQLHDSIAYNGESWDRWDEFDGYWGEDALRLLEDAGIAKVSVSNWEGSTNGRDGDQTWHDGAQCGCIEIGLELLTEQAGA